MTGLGRTGWFIRFWIGDAILEVIGIPCNRSQEMDKFKQAITL